MAKIDGNVLLVGAAVSYFSCIISFQALLSTTVDNPSVAVASTVVFSAAIPAAAYSLGWAIANGGEAAKAYRLALFASLYAFLSLAFLRAGELGFWASVAYSALGALGLFLGKLADGTDGRLHVVKSVMGFFLTSFVYTAGSDLPSAGCFLAVFALAATLSCFDLAGPRPGTPHAYVAGVYSSPAAARASSPVGVVRLVCLFVVVYSYSLWLVRCHGEFELSWKAFVGHIVGLILVMALAY